MSWFCFFFSSRRRHTRLQGDWSSDVCSSDLPAKLIETSVILSPRAESAGLRRRFDPLQLEWVVPSWAPRRARAPTGESAGLRRRKAPRDGAARRQQLSWAVKHTEPVPCATGSDV